MKRTRSQELYERSQKLAPAGVHSPVRAFRSVGGHPIFFEHGQGSKITDVDGNTYVDFCMSWGALALGHAHPNVVKAVQTQASLGTHFGTPTPLDVRLGELALEALAPYQKLRFVSSGTEAVMTAIRIARGFTGKNKIVKVEGSYHGHTDALLVAAGSGLVTQGETFSQGVPPGVIQDTLVIPCGSIAGLERAFQEYGDSIAAVIFEPIMANNGLFEFSNEFLARARELTLQNKALLIYDEVITGFRVGWGGAKALHGITPDIGTYGKILGGGLPVGAVAARAEIMDCLAPLGKVYQAGTLSGNPIAMAAGIATLEGIKNQDYYARVEKLGAYLDEKMMAVTRKKTSIPVFYRRIKGIFWICPGHDSDPGTPENLGDTARAAFKAIYHRMLDQGVYLAPSAFEVGFISSAHSTSDLDLLAHALETALNEAG